ncbi:hypothetical protein MCOR25_001397 [Pyricularia grisea]|uniref:Uncharacterized protein n=1 Tax=Pyricularia grisea TaxID=148305 RepID=A0A6P8BIP5_PYRGI|nr:uncharacterized protein PgNI_00891 [Pyricularia grisea]KAI6380871.1 hypothetical protein MCOR25_001397 [Pyricularia grisea]TLD16492.1 hypothetical protein PgNI_00891 [Pyricularia grisea]
MLLALEYISLAIYLVATLPLAASDSSTTECRQVQDLTRVHISARDARNEPLPPRLPDVSFHLEMTSSALSGEHSAATLPLEANETGATAADGSATRTVGPGSEPDATGDTFYLERGTNRLYLMSDDGRHRLYAFFQEVAPMDRLGFNRAHFIDDGVDAGYYNCEVTSQQQLACQGEDDPSQWVDWRLKDTTIMADREHNSTLPLVELLVKDIQNDAPH